MTYSQCLDYALTKWSEEGGYLVLGKSSHWCIPHVLHMDKEGEKLSHYIPHKHLPEPWYSLFGFRGHIKIGDDMDRGPIRPLCILLGTIALIVLGGVWVVKRNLRRYFKRK